MLTPEKLRQICPMPGARALELLPLLAAAMVEFKITSRTRAAAFLAQCGHESIDFKVWTENLNYSASGLLKTFGKYFNVATANTYARNPRMIANRVYANRMRNGAEQSGDGWRYRGRCPIQATGKEMYEWLSEALGLDLVNNPDLLLEPKTGLRAACAIFAVNKRCNQLADQLTGTGDAVDLARFDRTTKAINGGLNGAADRRARYKRALAVLTKNFTLKPSSSDAASSPTKAVKPDVKCPNPNCNYSAAPPVCTKCGTLVADGAANSATNESGSATNTVQPTEGSASASVKDFTKKYLVHTPTDSVKNIFFVICARIASTATALWNFGFTGRALLFLIAFAAIVPVVIAVTYYRPRLIDWGKQIWDGSFGE